MASAHSLRGVVLRTESAGSELSRNSKTSGIGHVPDSLGLSPVDSVPSPPVYVPQVEEGTRGMIGRSTKVYATDEGATTMTETERGKGYYTSMAQDEPTPTEIGMSNLSPRQETPQASDTSDTLARTLHQVSLFHMLVLVGVQVEAKICVCVAQILARPTNRMNRMKIGVSILKTILK